MKTSADHQQDAASRLACLLMLLSVFVSLLLLGKVLVYSQYGLDLSDESYYLITIANPWHYPNTTTQFGFIYHPLYALVNGDVALLRQANILITFALCWLLCFSALHSIFRYRAHDASFYGHTKKWVTAVAATALASSSLLFLNTWLPTPNYNSLTLQAFFLATTGLFSTLSDRQSIVRIGWVLIGIGGGMAFLAKPTAAASLAVLLLLYYAIAGTLNLRLLLLSAIAAVATLAISIWMMDGSLHGFISRLVRGLEYAGKLGGKHTASTLLRLDMPALGHRGTNNLVVFTVVLAALLSGFTAFRKRLALSASAALALTALTGAVMADVIYLKLSSTHFYGVQIISVVLGSTAFYLLARILWPHTTTPLSRSARALLLFLLLMPLASAFGTGRNIWLNIPWAASFWILASALLVQATWQSVSPWQKVLPLIVVTQLLTAVQVLEGMKHPYRQPQPLASNDQSVQVLAGHPLVLSSNFSEYLTNINAVARQYGFTPGTPMLDMTGHYPGTLLVMGGRSLGLPWLVGGYSGSEALATHALDKTPCEDMARAWILTEPDGRRKLSLDLLRRYGLDPDSYVQTETISSPVGEYDQDYRQMLLKPGKPPQETRLLCEQKRQERL